MALKIKDSGLRLGVERELREEFVAACRAEGKTAAAVLRECMQRVVERTRAGQQELFAMKGRVPPGNSNADGRPRPGKRRRDHESGGRERK